MVSRGVYQKELMVTHIPKIKIYHEYGYLSILEKSAKL